MVLFVAKSRAGHSHIFLINKMPHLFEILKYRDPDGVQVAWMQSFESTFAQQAG